MKVIQGILIGLVLCELLFCSKGAELHHNYGVTLHESGYLSMTSDSFFYNFIIALPGNLPERPESAAVFCESLFNVTEGGSTPYLNQCHQMEQMVETMYTATAKLATKLNETVSQTMMLLPKHVFNNREARKLFSFLGEMFEALTGSPSERSFQKLTSSVELIEGRQSYLAKSVSQLGNDFSAYMRFDDHRIHSLIKQLNSNNHVIAEKMNSLVQAIRKDFIQINTRAHYWKAYQLQLSYVFVTVMDHVQYNYQLQLSAEAMIETWMLATGQLVDQKLPMAMVDPNKLTTALEHVNDILVKERAGLEIEFKHPSWYYKHAMTHATYTDQAIYLQLTIPLTPTDSSNTFKVYQVIVNPVPIPGSNSQTTVQKLPDYLAISHDKHLAIELDLKTWVTCTGDVFKHCSGPLSV